MKNKFIILKIKKIKMLLLFQLNEKDLNNIKMNEKNQVKLLDLAHFGINITIKKENLDHVNLKYDLCILFLKTIQEIIQ